LTLLGFFIHQILHLESSIIALTGAFLLLLITGEHYLERALSRVEWTTIFFFIGLFVIVGGLVEKGVIESLASITINITKGNENATVIFILWLSAIASAFVDNA
jgi:Na+/H+ antiporter NhaD/arsenite permease-like protein